MCLIIEVTLANEKGLLWQFEDSRHLIDVEQSRFSGAKCMGFKGENVGSRETTKQ